MAKKKRAKPTIVINGKEVTLDSSLEKLVIEELVSQGHKFQYHPDPLYYITEPRRCKYTPDIVLPNGVIIEIKGYLRPEDAKKHLLVKSQNPEIDIRFVFENSKKKMTGRKLLTYADWCNKHGFLFVDKIIPPSWFL